MQSDIFFEKSYKYATNSCVTLLCSLGGDKPVISDFFSVGCVWECDSKKESVILGQTYLYKGT